MRCRREKEAFVPYCHHETSLHQYPSPSQGGRQEKTATWETKICHENSFKAASENVICRSSSLEYVANIAQGTTNIDVSYFCFLPALALKILERHRGPKTWVAG